MCAPVRGMLLFVIQGGRLLDQPDVYHRFRQDSMMLARSHEKLEYL